MRLTVLGCAGSYPSATSAASSYLVQADDGDGRTWTVLLDLGNGALGALQRWGDPGALDGVGLSHLHADHCADMAVLTVLRRYAPGGPAATLPVWGPPGTAARVAALGGKDVADDTAGVFTFGTWDPSAPIVLGPLRLEPVAMHHSLPDFGIRVVGPSELDPGRTVTIAYTGDTDECPGLGALAAGVDLLLCEAAFHEGRDDATRGVHLTGRRAGLAAARGAVGGLLLTHIPAWNDPDRTLAEAGAVFDGSIDLAQPGRTWTV